MEKLLMAAIDEITALKAEIEKLKDENLTLKFRLDVKDSEIAELKSKISNDTESEDEDDDDF